LQGKRKALLVKDEVSWVGPAIVLFSTLWVSLGLGVGIGLWNKKFMLVVGISRGFTGVIGLVKGLF
jgi:hypothetical protein